VTDDGHRIRHLANDFRVKQAISSLGEAVADLVDLIIAVQQIPAPTFEEAERATFIEKCFIDLGLHDVQHDALHNVFGCLPGTNRNLADPVIVSAHSDTVFPEETDLTTKRVGKLLYGPGIGDNATGVAGNITLAKLLKLYNLTPRADIWLVANVGEEGLGNLRGMQAVVKRFGRNARYIVIEGGSYGQLMYQAIGVRRFRLTVETPGGHSWGSFGQPSAVHELGIFINDVARIHVPRSPKTTFNIGVIEGGTAVNTIASSASLLLDLRSEQMATLDQLVSQVSAIVNSRQDKVIQSNQDVKFHFQEVGNRPAGKISRDDLLVRYAEEALTHVGWPQIAHIAGSTDANIPLSQKIPSVCIGLTTSGNSHRIDEYIDLAHLQAGMEQLLLLTLAAADY